MGKGSDAFVSCCNCRTRVEFEGGCRQVAQLADEEVGEGDQVFGGGKCQGSCRFGHAAPRSRKTASRWSSPAGTGEAGGGRQRSVDRSVVSVSGVLGR